MVAARLRGFRQGLKESGYVEGENVAIVYGWGEDQIDRLPSLAVDLVRRPVAAIVASGPPSSFAAKAATTTIPIVFLVGNDPVQLGLATSLSRPGGNMTGINIFNSELASKRLELLRDLLPRAARIALLVNPADASLTETQLKDVNTAARSMGVQIQVHNADTQRRDRCRLRGDGSRATRCRRCRDHPVFERSACPTGSSGGVSPTPGHIRRT